MTQNPSQHLAWIYFAPSHRKVARWRGLAFFKEMKRLGFHCQIIPGDTPQGTMVHLEFWPPVTCIYAPAELRIDTARMRSHPVVPVAVILDCHFPITRPDEIDLPPDADRAAVVDAIPEVLDAMRLARAVTCPDPQTAADLAALGIPAYVLPDITDDSTSLARFSMAMLDIAATAVRAAVSEWTPPSQGED
jgi:hypothetical protein